MEIGVVAKKFANVNSVQLAGLSAEQSMRTAERVLERSLSLIMRFSNRTAIVPIKSPDRAITLPIAEARNCKKRLWQKIIALT